MTGWRRTPSETRASDVKLIRHQDQVVVKHPLGAGFRYKIHKKIDDAFYYARTYMPPECFYFWCSRTASYQGVFFVIRIPNLPNARALSLSFVWYWLSPRALTEVIITSQTSGEKHRTHARVYFYSSLGVGAVAFTYTLDALKLPHVCWAGCPSKWMYARSLHVPPKNSTHESDVFLRCLSQKIFTVFCCRRAQGRNGATLLPISASSLPPTAACKKCSRCRGWRWVRSCEKMTINWLYSFVFLYARYKRKHATFLDFTLCRVNKSLHHLIFWTG